MSYFTFTLLILSSLINAYAEVGGEIHMEFKQFRDDNLPKTIDQSFSVLSKLRSSYESDHFKLKAEILSRVDKDDSQKDVIIPQDLNITYQVGEEWIWHTTFGFKIYNWSVMESFHPSDFINSKNYQTTFDGIEKRGQLIAEMGLDWNGGGINLFSILRQEDPIYPSSQSRLGFEFDVPTPYYVKAPYTLSQDKWRLPIWPGIRINHSFENFDLALFSVTTYDRETPYVNFEYILPPLGPVNFEIDPLYFPATYHGFTFQRPFDNLILKAEAVIKQYQEKFPLKNQYQQIFFPKDYNTIAVGAEYGIEHPDAGSQSLFLIEYQNITEAKSIRSKMGAFQNDLMLAYRYSFNDTDGKELTVISIFDLDNNDIGAVLDYTQRYDSNWKIKTGLRYFEVKDTEAVINGISHLRGDHHFYLTLGRYF